MPTLSVHGFLQRPTAESPDTKFRPNLRRLKISSQKKISILIGYQLRLQGFTLFNPAYEVATNLEQNALLKQQPSEFFPKSL